MTQGALLATLENGTAVEVAGYELAPALARAMSAMTLKLPERIRAVACLECSSDEAPSLSPGTNRRVDSWRAEGIAVHAEAVRGEPFWATQEIAEAPALLAATRQVFSGWE